MTKTMMALATAATLAVTAMAAPAPAEARGGRGAATCRRPRARRDRRCCDRIQPPGLRLSAGLLCPGSGLLRPVLLLDPRAILGRLRLARPPRPGLLTAHRSGLTWKKRPPWALFSCPGRGRAGLRRSLSGPISYTLMHTGRWPGNRAIMRNQDFVGASRPHLKGGFDEEASGRSRRCRPGRRGNDRDRKRRFGATLSPPSPSSRRRPGHRPLIGGLAAGAIIGGAIASSRPAYAYPPGYYAPGYAPGYGPAPVEYYDEPVCTIQPQQYWDGFNWRVRNVRVCN